MEDAQNGDCLALVLEKDYVWESIKHRDTKLLMDATKGIGPLGDGLNTITDRIPKSIAKVEGDIVVVRDGGS